MTTLPHLSIWIVEDNTLVRETTAAALREGGGVTCTGAFRDCESMLEALDTESPPSVVLMDIGLPGMDGIEGVREVRRRAPSTRVVMFTVHEDDDRVFEAICAGASGYLLKPSSSDELRVAVEEMRRGGAAINARIARRVLDLFQNLAAPRHDYGLTEREREVLGLLVDGLSKKQIAARLILSEHTIHSHVRNIYEKLEVHSRGGAVAKAVRERLF